MLIFVMGLYRLFISNVNPDVSADVDRSLKGSSLFGMFGLKERPKWMKISSLNELSTKVGHVIVVILLVKMFERSKVVMIATDLSKEANLATRQDLTLMTMIFFRWSNVMEWLLHRQYLIPKLLPHRLFPNARYSLWIDGKF